MIRNSVTLLRVDASKFMFPINVLQVITCEAVFVAILSECFIRLTLGHSNRMKAAMIIRMAMIARNPNWVKVYETHVRAEKYLPR